MSDVLAPADHLPQCGVVSHARVRRAAVLWVLAIAGLVVLIRFDVAIMAWLERHEASHDHPVLRWLRELAEHQFIAALCLAILIFDRRRIVIVAHLLFAILIGFGFMCVGKMSIHRERPARFNHQFDDVAWSASWHGFDIDPSRAIRSAMDASMPSGHTYAAFAIALTLAWFYPRWRIPMILLAAGTACSRVLERLHWPSDCWAGAALGILAAWLSLRTRTLCSPGRWFRGNSASPHRQPGGG